MQAIQLLVDDHPEGMAHNAALNMGFGQATHPQINTVDTLHRHRAIVIVDQRDIGVHHLEGRDCLGGFQFQVRIGRFELGDHVIRQPVACLEIIPAGIGCHIHVRQCNRFADIGVCRCGQICLDLVHRAQAHIAATGGVEGEQIGADTHQIVAHTINHLQVHLFGCLRQQPTQDVGHTMLGIARRRRVAILCQRAQGCGPRHICHTIVVHIGLEHLFRVGWVQEGVIHRHIHRVAIGIQNGQRLADLRVAKAVGRCGKLVADAAIGLGVVFVVAMAARALQPTQQAIGKVVEDNLLIFADVQDACSLEQLFWGAIEACFFQLLDVVVVVACPDGVHRGQAHVLVRAPVATDKVVKQVDERVRVDQQRPAFAHEVARQGRNCGGVVAAIFHHQIGVVVHQRHIALVSALEHGAGIDVMIEQLAQGWQQVFAWRRGVFLACKDARAHPLIAIAFAQQLTNQAGGTVNLVLVHHRRGDVLMQRRAVFVVANHAAAGQVGRVVTARAAHVCATDGDLVQRLAIRAGAFGNKGQTVVEILAEGHHEHIGRSCLFSGRVLRPQQVRDGAGIQTVKDRVHHPCPIVTDTGIAGLGDAGEWQGCRARDIGVLRVVA